MKKFLPSLNNLFTTIGYAFKRTDLVDLALTHSSLGKKNNQRLEFLGDALLNMIIAEYLYQDLSGAREGDLTILRANLVKESMLAKIAKNYRLDHFIRLGEGELRNNGKNRSSILADCLEALIAAIYLDSDLAVTKQVVLNWYRSVLPEGLVGNSAVKAPKTLLQETLQATGADLPMYRVVRTEGKLHRQTFYVECKINGLDPAQGVGPTKKAAESMAAANLLEQLLGKKHDTH